MTASSGFVSAPYASTFFILYYAFALLHWEIECTHRYCHNLYFHLVKSLFCLINPGLWCICACELNGEQQSWKGCSSKFNNPRFWLHWQSEEPSWSRMPRHSLLRRHHCFGCKRFRSSHSRDSKIKTILFRLSLEEWKNGLFTCCVCLMSVTGRSILESSDRSKRWDDLQVLRSLGQHSISIQQLHYSPNTVCQPGSRLKRLGLALR